MTSYGAIASQEWGVTAPPVGIVPYVQADFTTATYKIDGATVTIADIFSGTIDLADISGSGLAPWESNDSRFTLDAAILTAVYAFLDTGITFVFEVDWNGSVTDDGPLMLMGDGADPDAASWIVQVDVDQNTILPNDHSVISVQDYDELSGEAELVPVHPGIVRYAFTLGRPDSGVFKNEASLTGGPSSDLGDTTYDAKANFPSLDFAQLFGSDTWFWFFEDAYIRKFEIYEAVSAADLLVVAAAGRPLVIESSPSIDAMDGLAYTAAAQGYGGVPPYSYSVASGAIPTGLSLNSSTGAITGTPTTPGAYTFTLRVTDDDSDTADTSSIVVTVRDVLTLKTFNAHTTSGTTHTYTDVPFGVADASRLIVVMANSGNGVNISSMTVGGVSAAQAVHIGGLDIWVAEVPTGIDGTIVVNNASSSNSYISVFPTYGLTDTVSDSDTVVAGFSTTHRQITLTVPNPTIVFAASYDGLSTSATWTNAREQSDLVVQSAHFYTDAFAYVAAGSSLTVECDTSHSSAGGLIAIALAP